MKWKKTKKRVSDDRFVVAYTQQFDNKKLTDKKSEIRYKIEKNVFDLEDSVADNAKMISLLISALSRIYSILPDENKNLLSEEDKHVIELVFNKFKETTTVADKQLERKGVKAITDMLERQQKLTDLIYGDKEE